MSIEDKNENIGDERAGEPVSAAIGPELSDEEERIWTREGFDDLPLAMSVPVVARYLGVSKSTAYNLCKAGIIRARRFGARMLVTRSELFRLPHGPDSSSAVAQRLSSPLLGTL